MENLDLRRQKELVVVFTEVVNQEQEEINPTDLWNWIQNVCKSCRFGSSEGQCINSTEVTNEKELDKLKRMKEHHDTPAAGHSV